MASNLRLQQVWLAFCSCIMVVGGGVATENSYAAPGTMSLVYPVMGPRMSGDFGMRKHPIKKRHHHHHGIDLAAPMGAPIRSIAAGQVIYADPFGGYGKIVVVRHASGLTSHYGHCAELNVQIGDRVAAGDIIGTVGSTGLSTGPHLHFEIRIDGKPQNPERYLPGLDSPAEG